MGARAQVASGDKDEGLEPASEGALDEYESADSLCGLAGSHRCHDYVIPVTAAGGPPHHHQGGMGLPLPEIQSRRLYPNCHSSTTILWVLHV
jgi:hypothetical protein